MDGRITWTENLACPSCGKLGKVRFSRPDDVPRGERDRVESGVSGFKTETTEKGFQFRCVDCNKVAKITRSN
jgi:hypothetical protein